jgi:hypothetical protein
MLDLIVTMARPSTSPALGELEQLQVLNEVLDDEIISECSSDEDSVFNNDYTQLVTPGTQVISDSDSDDDPEEWQKENIKVRL